MYRQMEQALDKMDSSSQQSQEKIRAILRRYVDEGIGIDEAYYELLDGDLIPMPQRCGISAKLPLTSEDERRLKEKIKRKLLQQSS